MKPARDSYVCGVTPRLGTLHVYFVYHAYYLPFSKLLSHTNLPPQRSLHTNFPPQRSFPERLHARAHALLAVT